MLETMMKTPFRRGVIFHCPRGVIIACPLTKPAGQAVGFDVIEDDLNSVFRGFLNPAGLRTASGQEKAGASDHQAGRTTPILHKRTILAWHIFPSTGHFSLDLFQYNKRIS